jgi:hypothetical protein
MTQIRNVFLILLVTLFFSLAASFLLIFIDSIFHVRDIIANIPRVLIPIPNLTQ